MTRALLRWWHAPGRTPRPFRVCVAVVCGCAALALTLHGASAHGAANPATSTPVKVSAASAGDPPSTARAKTTYPPGPGDLVAHITSSSPTVLAAGRALYVSHCASCHNLNLAGRGGIAPSLIGAGAGPVDFYVSTGRMPLQKYNDEPLRTPSMFDGAQRRSIVSYVYSAGGGPPAPAADPLKGSFAQGLRVFTSDCAGCHQIVARGGLTVGAQVPNLQQATAQQIAEAVRFGPYLMPRFSPKEIDQTELNSLVRYVLWTRAASNRGGWGIYNIGPIPEGLVTWLLAMTALVIVIRLIGEREPA